jgi:UDP-glucose:(heptosyl)LPS alpha-1,3-glucosyltransferase
LEGVDPGPGESVRVALVHPRFVHAGGAERYALGLAQGLAARGHEVHLFGRRRGGLPPNLTFHRIPFFPFGRTLKTLSFWALTRPLARSGRYNVVQGFGKTTCQTVHRTGAGIHRSYLERKGTIRLTAYDRVAVRIEDELYGSPVLRAIICPSTWIAGELKRYYPDAAAKVRIIPNGVDTGFFRPEDRITDRERTAARLGVPRGAPVLLFAATNFSLKGLSLAIEVLAKLPEAHLLVAGGDNPGPYRSQATGSGVGDRVHFLGAVEDLRGLYRTADVLLHPTRYDPFANVCLEAMACGTPVVTSDRNGASDLFAENRGGEAIPISQGAPAFVAAVQRFLALGDRARSETRLVALRCDQSRHLDAVLSLYHSVTGGAQGIASGGG